MKLPLVVIVSCLSLATAATYPDCYPSCGIDNGRAKRLTTFGKSHGIPINREFSRRYYSDNSGRYYHDDSGRYIHQYNPYIHQDVPYIHDDSGIYPGDDSGKYVHQDVPYIHIVGPNGPDGPGGPNGPDGPGGPNGGYEYKKPFGPTPGQVHPNSIDYKYLPAREKLIETTYLPARQSINSIYLPALRN